MTHLVVEGRNELLVDLNAVRSGIGSSSLDAEGWVGTVFRL